MKRWIFLCSSLLVFWMASVALAELYSWKDESGNVHYADRLDSVPPEYRNQVEVSNPVERRSDTWDLSQGAKPAKKEKEENAEPTLSEIVERVGLAKFVMFSLLGFVIFTLVQVFILKKACRLVGESEPWGLGQSGGIVVLEWLGGAVPNTALTLALHYGLFTADDVQVKITAMIATTVVGIVLQVAVLRLLLVQSIAGAAKVWLGQILVTMFLAAVLAGLGYLLSFCSGFMKDASAM